MHVVGQGLPEGVSLLRGNGEATFFSFCLIVVVFVGVWAWACVACVLCVSVSVYFCAGVDAFVVAAILSYMYFFYLQSLEWCQQMEPLQSPQRSFCLVAQNDVNPKDR